MGKTLLEFTKHNDSTKISIVRDKIMYVSPVFSERRTFEDTRVSLGTDIMLQGGLKVHVVEDYEDVLTALDNPSIV